MASLNKTPLFDYHFEVGAKMVPIGNWTMPFQFGDGCKNEYLHAFEGTCITDFCCAAIYRMTSSNAVRMQEITGIASVGECGIYEWRRDDFLVDVPFVVNMAENDFLTAFAPSAKNCCNEAFDAENMQDLSELFGCIAVWGRDCMTTLSNLGVDVENWQCGTSRKIEISSVRCIANYVELADGLPAVILFFDREKADDVWIALFNTPGVWAAGLGAWDAVRLQQILVPYNTVNCRLPLLLCRWDGRKYPSKFAKVEWMVKNELQQSQVIYASVVPDADGMLLLFSGKFEADSVVKMPENKDESGVLLEQRC